MFRHGMLFHGFSAGISPKSQDAASESEIFREVLRPKKGAQDDSILGMLGSLQRLLSLRCRIRTPSHVIKTRAVVTNFQAKTERHMRSKSERQSYQISTSAAIISAAEDQRRKRIESSRLTSFGLS